MNLDPNIVAALALWVVCLLMYAVRAGVNLERRRQRRRYPFTWSCPIPQCRFEVMGHDPGFVLDKTTAHEREHRHARP